MFDNDEEMVKMKVSSKNTKRPLKTNELGIKTIKELSSLSESGDKKTAIKILMIKGEKFLDIRKMFLDSTNKWQPTSKGICLSYEEFQILESSFDKITDELVK